MKKNSKKTFSQRAQDLVKKYSRSNFDKVEKQELDAALQKLQEEQELYKQVNKIGEYSDEAMAQKAMQQQEMMAQQGQMQPDSQVGQMPQFDGISGTSFMDINDEYNFANNTLVNGAEVPLARYAYPNKVKYTDSNYAFADINSNDGITSNTIYNSNNYNSSYNSKLPTVLNALSPTGAAGDKFIKKQGELGNKIAGEFAYAGTYANPIKQSTTNQDQQIGQTQSILPSVIAGGIGMLGNIALGAGVKEYKLNQSYGADQISLAKERERLAREATAARNIGMRNLRGAGSRGAYLAGAGNVSAGVNQQLGDALSKSYFNEETTNLAQREKAAALNRQVEMMNYQAKINADNERKGYYAAAAGIPAQTMADIGKINYQNSALLSSGTDNYIAGTNGKANPWKSQQIYRKFKK